MAQAILSFNPGNAMLNAVYPGSMRDAEFTRKIEEATGQDISTCYQCGNCTASCPAAFVYDRQVNQIMRAVQLGLKKQALSCASIWYCLSCSLCTLRCPNNIDVAAIMETLRHTAREEGYVAVPAMDKFWLSFMDTVRAFGRVYEVGTMSLYMLRSLKMNTDLDLAAPALSRRKLPFIPPLSREGAGAVGRIISRYREREKKRERS